MIGFLAEYTALYCQRAGRGYAGSGTFRQATPAASARVRSASSIRHPTTTARAASPNTAPSASALSRLRWIVGTDSAGHLDRYPDRRPFATPLRVQNGVGRHDQVLLVDTDATGIRRVVDRVRELRLVLMERALHDPDAS